MKDFLQALKDFDLSSPQAVALLLLAAMILVYKASKNADEYLNDDSRVKVSNGLLGVHGNSLSHWIPNFTVVFDRFFSKNHFGLKCIWRSLGISIVSFSLVSIIVGEKFETGQIPAMLIIMVLVNGLGDYMSLLETRYLLNIRCNLVVRIFLDVIFSVGIIIIWAIITFPILMFTLGDENFSASKYIQLLLEAPSFYLDGEGVTLLLIYILTSLTTSLWFWGHGLGQFVIFYLRGFRTIMNSISVSDSPIKSIGLVLNLTILITSLILYAIYFTGKFLLQIAL